MSKKCSEIHLLTDVSRCNECAPIDVHTNYISTQNAIHSGTPIVYTTITDFLSFAHSKRLFVHYRNQSYEITLGQCEGTNRQIKSGHNLRKLLFGGEFDWFDG